MLLRVPASWPEPAVAGMAMLLLAVLDLAGSFAAKEAVLRRSPTFAVGGALLFLAVFWVYASSLKVVDLSAVTFGWIVILQVGVVLLDRIRYGVLLAPGAWLAIAVLIAAQAYLVLAPAPSRAAPRADPELQVVLPDSVPGSAERGDDVLEGMDGDVGQPGGAQGADGHPADQQGLPHGLVARIAHVPPQLTSPEPSVAVRE